METSSEKKLWNQFYIDQRTHLISIQKKNTAPESFHSTSESSIYCHFNNKAFETGLKCHSLYKLSAVKNSTSQSAEE